MLGFYICNQLFLLPINRTFITLKTYAPINTYSSKLCFLGDNFYLWPIGRNNVNYVTYIH